jgi:hypothetical protein
MSHRFLIIFIFHEMNKGILELEVQELLVEIILGPRLDWVSAQCTYTDDVCERTRTIPKVPSALGHSATMRFGVDGLPQTMVSLKASMEIGSKSLGSRYGICRLIHFKAA